MVCIRMTAVFRSNSTSNGGFCRDSYYCTIAFAVAVLTALFQGEPMRMGVDVWLMIHHRGVPPPIEN